MARVFVITGPSGVGKGTLIRGLLERVPELGLSVSATTRAPRPGETQGVDYHFLGPEEFERRVAGGEFVEHATYSGRRYGTLRAELEGRLRRGEPVVLEIEVQGARQVREAMPEALQVFIAPPSREALRARLVGRGTDTPEQVERGCAPPRASSRPSPSSATSWSTTASRTRSTSSSTSCAERSAPPPRPPPSSAAAGTGAGQSRLSREAGVAGTLRVTRRRG